MLYTQCRGCGEVFIIDAEHLTLAHGQVRCHVCGTVFDALQTLTAEQPLDGEDLLLHDDGHAPPLLTRSFHLDTDDSDIDTSQQDDFSVEPVILSADSEGFVVDFGDDDTPDFLDPEAKTLKAELPYEDSASTHQSGQKWWGLMSISLVLALIWQAQMALADGRLRLPESSWADKICDSLNCAKQNRPLDLTQISLVSRNIRSHPGRDNALIISASMIKTHSDDQRFPALSIRLSDLNGEVIAMRRFKADEYLTSDILQAGFINNTLIPITLEIKNPGEHAVAFEIGFSQP